MYPFVFRGGAQNRAGRTSTRFCEPPRNGHNQPDHGEEARTHRYLELYNQSSRHLWVRAS